jgi:hypothetical protein
MKRRRFLVDKPDKIDFSKLLGFGLVTEELAEKVDFQNETFGGRLGAKVGEKPTDLQEISDTDHN